MEKTTNAVAAKNVDEYLQQFPKDVQTVLQQLRQTIKKAAPKAEEVISYQIPTYKYFGPVVHFAAFKNHCSFFGVSKNMLKMFEKELKSHKISGTTIHFTADNPLPSTVVEKIVKLRMKENEESNAVKENAKLKAGK